MSSVMMPKKKEEGAGLSSLLQLGGMAIGGLAGGPGGAAIGSQLGGLAGGMMSKAPEQGPQGVDSPMSRRFQAKQTDPMQALKEGALALHSPGIDPELKKQYARPVMTAYMQAAKQKGLQNPFEGFPEV